MSGAFLQRRPLAEARAMLLAGVAPVASQRVDASDAGGRVAAEDVVARHASPHYRASAMDGIAVRAADTSRAPLLLRPVEATSPAPPEGDACAVAVDTGSLLPDWADAVIRIEDVAAESGGWRIKAPVPPGRDLRRAAEDFAAGTLLVAAGTVLRPWHLGALLATGTTEVAVRRRPRIAILATGSEVVEPGGDAAPGHVIESNSRVIAAMVEEWGGSAHRLGIVADDEEKIAAAIGDAAERFDAVCVIAGSSAGRKDFTIAALSRLGELVVHGVDIAPGRPVALARLRRRDGARPFAPAIAVPGYPVSAIVVCDQLLRPLVTALLGVPESGPVTVRAELRRALPSRLGMDEFRRVCLVAQDDGRLVAAPLPSGASAISTITDAHGWLRIEAAAEGIDAGSEVDVELLVPERDVRSAFVLGGLPDPRAGRLERELRRGDPRARVRSLRLAKEDAAAALQRGEAHGVLLEEGEPAAEGLELVSGRGLRLAVAPGAAARRAAAALSG